MFCYSISFVSDPFIENNFTNNSVVCEAIEYATKIILIHKSYLPPISTFFVWFTICYVGARQNKA